MQFSILGIKPSILGERTGRNSGSTMSLVPLGKSGKRDTDQNQLKIPVHHNLQVQQQLRSADLRTWMTLMKPQPQVPVIHLKPTFCRQRSELTTLSSIGMPSSKLTQMKNLPVLHSTICQPQVSSS